MATILSMLLLFCHQNIEAVHAGNGAVTASFDQSDNFVHEPSNNSLDGPPNNNELAARPIRFEVKPDQQTAFRNAISDYVTSSLDDESNVISEAYYEEDDASILWIIERWNNKTALEKAGRSASFKALESLAKTALSKPSKTIDVKDLEPLSKEQWRGVVRKTDSPITIMLFVDAKAGSEQKFKTVYHTAMPKFRSEPGVITYQLSQLESDNTQFVTYEKFRSEDAFQYHLKFPPIQPVIDFLDTSIKRQPFQDGLHRLIEFAPIIRK